MLPPQPSQDGETLSRFGSSAFSNWVISTPACPDSCFASLMTSTMVQNLLNDITSVKKTLMASAEIMHEIQYAHYEDYYTMFMVSDVKIK